MKRALKRIKYMNILRTIFVAVIALALYNCGSRDKNAIDSYFGIDVPKDSLNAFLEDRIADLNIPGLSMAMINDGQVVHHVNYGYADLEHKKPITDQTIFEGASISKSVFAFFVMTFVEEGKLNLDRPLYEYLPYPDIAHDERYKKITARMVLSHRSGFPNWRQNEPDEKLVIKFDPGTDYEYSGEGYQYLAMVLKHIENTDWKGLEAIFQRKIAEPLGMEHTVFLQTPYTRKHKAEPYDEKGERVDWENGDWNRNRPGEFGAAYSIHTEPMDFSKWMIGVMDKKILSTESYAELFREHSDLPDEDMDMAYTLGFYAPPLPFSNTYGHGGNNDGFTCMFMLNTEKDWGYVLFTNSEYGQQLGEELFEYLIVGPDLTMVYVVGALLGLLLLSAVFLAIRWLVRRRRKRNGSRNENTFA